jgi:hypothetical protein
MGDENENRHGRRDTCAASAGDDRQNLELRKCTHLLFLETSQAEIPAGHTRFMLAIRFDTTSTAVQELWMNVCMMAMRSYPGTTAHSGK